MATMTKEQRLWFAGVFDVVGSVYIKEGVGPTGKETRVMEVRVEYVEPSVVDRLAHFLGNGWEEGKNSFVLRGNAACRGLFAEIWGDITKDSRARINAKLRELKSSDR